MAYAPFHPRLYPGQWCPRRVEGSTRWEVFNVDYPDEVYPFESEDVAYACCRCFNAGIKTQYLLNQQYLIVSSGTFSLRGGLSRQPFIIPFESPWPWVTILVLMLLCLDRVVILDDSKSRMQRAIRWRAKTQHVIKRVLWGTGKPVL